MSDKKLTPGTNWLWEHNRMILPEQAQNYARYRKEMQRRPRIQLTEDVERGYARLFERSLRGGQVLRISLYDPFEDLFVIGPVEAVSQYGRFKVDGEWFAIADIQNVETQERDL